MIVDERTLVNYDYISKRRMEGSHLTQAEARSMADSYMASISRCGYFMHQHVDGGRR